MHQNRDGVHQAGALPAAQITTDIDAILAGETILTDLPVSSLRSGKNQSLGQVVIYDAETGDDLTPFDESKLGTVIMIPDNGRDPNPPMPEGPNRRTLARLFPDSAPPQAEPPPEQPKPKAKKPRRVPPVEHRFKPGQSGNPGGRPKLTISKILQDLLAAGEHKYTKHIAGVLVARACEGNLFAIRELLRRTEPLPKEPKANPTPSDP